MAKDRLLGVKMSDEMLTAIMRIAEVQGKRSAASIVRQAMREWLLKKGFKVDEADSKND